MHRKTKKNKIIIFCLLVTILIGFLQIQNTKAVTEDRYYEDEFIKVPWGEMTSDGMKTRLNHPAGNSLYLTENDSFRTLLWIEPKVLQNDEMVVVRVNRENIQGAALTNTISMRTDKYNPNILYDFVNARNGSMDSVTFNGIVTTPDAEKIKIPYDYTIVKYKQGYPETAIDAINENTVWHALPDLEIETYEYKVGIQRPNQDTIWTKFSKDERCQVKHSIECEKGETIKIFYSLKTSNQRSGTFDLYFSDVSPADKVVTYVDHSIKINGKFDPNKEYYLKHGYSYQLYDSNEKELLISLDAVVTGEQPDGYTIPGIYFGCRTYPQYSSAFDIGTLIPRTGKLGKCTVKPGTPSHDKIWEDVIVSEQGESHIQHAPTKDIKYTVNNVDVQCENVKLELKNDAGIIVENNIPLINHHAWSEWTTETSTSDFYGTQTIQKRTCALCGKVEEEVVDPCTHLHKYHQDGYTYHETATCTDEGYANYVCSVCGKEKHKTLMPPLGHYYRYTTKPDAITYENSIIGTLDCRYADHKNLNIVMPSNQKNHTHKYELIKTVEPDCDNQGFDILICECGAAKISNIVPKTQHNWTDWVVSESNVYKTRKCQTCGYTEQVLIDESTTFPEDLTLSQSEVIIRNTSKADEETTTIPVVKAGDQLEYRFTLMNELEFMTPAQMARIKLPNNKDFVFESYDDSRNNVSYGGYDPESNVVYFKIRKLDSFESASFGFTIKVSQNAKKPQTYTINAEWRESEYANEAVPTARMQEEILDYNNDELEWFKGTPLTVQIADFKIQPSDNIPVLYNLPPTDVNAKSIFAIPYEGTRLNWVTTVAQSPIYFEEQLDKNGKLIIDETSYQVNGTPVEYFTGNIKTNDPVIYSAIVKGKTPNQIINVDSSATFISSKPGIEKSMRIAPSISTTVRTELTDSINFIYMDSPENYQKTNDSKPATCLEDGYFGMEIAGQTYYMIEHAHGHEWDETNVEYKEIEGEMWEIIHCKNCGATKKNKHTHVMETITNDLPTCENPGLIVKKCSCGYTETIKPEKLGHDMTEWSVVKEATEESEGLRERHCQRDGCSYKETETINKLEHVHIFETTTVPPTCTEQGYDKHTCKCGKTQPDDNFVAALGHDMGEWEITKEPTADSKGEKIRKCKRDGCTFTETEKFECEHVYKDVITAPTCIDQGFTTHTCEKCNKTFIDTYVAALGHDFGKWVTVKEPTEDETGLEERTCQREGCTVKETHVLDKLPHTHQYIDEVIAPTCTKPGYTLHTCIKGDHEYKDSETPALGHDWSDWVVTEKPTEEKVGTETKTCKRCGIEETRDIPKLEHKHKYIDKVVQPTCTTPGYTLHTCEKGDHEYKDNEIPALGHDLGEWVIVKQPTTEEEGTRERTCSRCDYRETESIQKLHKHEYVDEVIAPTCTESGYTIHRCSCGKSYTDTKTEPLGHDWTDWETVKDPTEDAEGLQERTCKRCNIKETKKIDKLNHQHRYDKTVVNPTCTEQGYTEYECECGEKYKDDYVDALGHNWGDWETTKKPTTEKTGERTRTCKRCDTVETEIIPKLKDNNSNDKKPENNKPEDPKLGFEGTNETLAWISIFILSCAAITAMGYFTFKKKKSK